jgi:hypothetical protein
MLKEPSRGIHTATAPTTTLVYSLLSLAMASKLKNLKSWHTLL